MQTVKSSCDICTETYTSKRCAVTCAKCDKHACIQCYKPFILKHTDDPACIYCRHPLEEEYLRGIIPQAFWNTDYKRSRCDKLFEREKSFISATMPAVESYRERQKLKTMHDAMSQQVKEITLELTNAKEELHRLHDSIQWQSYAIDGHHIALRDTRQKSRLPCSSNDCRGFCVEEICVVCEQKTCSKCLVQKSEGHTCRQEDLETVRYIFHNSRPCPCCNQPIDKTEGCDQMYCVVVCSTSFSWKTGRIETGRIHNPHAYENMGINRQRDIQDEICGGMPSYRSVMRVMTTDNYVKKRCVLFYPSKEDLIYCVDDTSKDANVFRYSRDQRRKVTKMKKYKYIIVDMNTKNGSC